jgi:RNA polymerase sigma-70 factor (ECF subfamily)
MSGLGESSENAYGAATWQGATVAPETDEALAARAASDSVATEELYRRYVNRVYTYCKRRLDSEETVRDATSAIMVRALEGLYRKRIDNVSSWIFSIAHNEVIDIYRRRRDTVGLEFAANVADDGLSPESLVVARSAAGELRELITQLSADQQSVVTLRLAGLDGTEICAVLGRSRSWVDTTQFRAVRRLRELMHVDLAPEAP